jgi:hypothetical protein
MSSLAVRTEVTSWLNANYSATPWFDLSYHFDIDEISGNQRDPFLLVQFAAPNEAISSMGPGNCWREDGVIFLHMVAPVGGDVNAQILNSENLRVSLRGKRIGITVIESVTPPTDVDGASIQFDGNWHGFSMRCDYTADHGPD